MHIFNPVSINLHKPPRCEMFAAKKLITRVTDFIRFFSVVSIGALSFSIKKNNALGFCSILQRR